MRAPYRIAVLGLVLVLLGAGVLGSAEPLQATRPLDLGRFERREPPTPALPFGSRGPEVPDAARPRPAASPPEPGSRPSAVSYHYDALGRIQEIVRVPGN
jgi:hypothetical protein